MVGRRRIDLAVAAVMAVDRVAQIPPPHREATGHQPDRRAASSIGPAEKAGIDGAAHAVSLRPSCVQPAVPCLPVGAKPRAAAKSTARGYDWAWRRVRLEVLERDGWECRLRLACCITDATTIDHRISLVRGGARLDPANLQAACGPCNDAKGGR